MFDECNVVNLKSEYQYLSSRSDEDIQSALVINHDWTTEASAEVIHLARAKGVFLLRNALALASVLNIEDGDQGY